MYSYLLVIHSLFRWAVVIALVLAIYKSFDGWFNNKKFTRTDNSIRHITATIVHIQLILGVWLYFISPLVDYFLKNFKSAVHKREPRFFGMEHITVMIIAIIIITIGSALAKRKQNDKEKFKIMAIWFSIGLFLILTSIPWKFSPLTSRPYYRIF